MGVVSGSCGHSIGEYLTKPVGGGFHGGRSDRCTSSIEDDFRFFCRGDKRLPRVFVRHPAVPWLPGKFPVLPKSRSGRDGPSRRQKIELTEPDRGVN